MDFSARDHQRGDAGGGSQTDGAPPSMLDFVFGNVDSGLQLEGNDLLDDDAKRMLPNLSHHVSETVGQIINPSDLEHQNLSAEDKNRLHTTTEDYYATDEIFPAVEMASTVRREPASVPNALDGPSSTATSSFMGPPRLDTYKSPYAHFPPKSSLSHTPARLSLPQAVDDITSDKPLASLLPVEMMDVDVRDVYPDFTDDKPLKWNRLFRSQIEPRFLPPEPAAAQPIASTENKEYQIVDSSIRSDDDADMLVARDSSGYSFEDILADLQRPWCPLSGSCAKTDDSTALDGSTSFVNSLNPDGSRSELSLNDYNWRHGAAECWYDKAGVSESGREYFDRKKKSATPPNAETTGASSSGIRVDELDDDDMDGEDEEITNEAQAAKDFLKPFNLSELGGDREGPWLTSYLYEWEKDVVTDIDTDEIGKTNSADNKYHTSTQRQWQIHVQRMRNMPWTSTYMMARVMHARKMQIEQQRTGVQNPNAPRDPHIDAILARYTDEELLYFQKMAVSQKSMVNEVEWEKDVLKFVHEGILPPPEPPLFFIRDFRTCLFKPDESKLYKPSEWKELQRKREDCCEYVNTITPANTEIERVLDSVAAAEAQNNSLKFAANTTGGFAATHHFKAVLQLGRQDFLNVSRDAEYYRSSVKQAATAVTKSALKVSALSATHSIPAMQLYPKFFPPLWTPERLRHFHRTQLQLPQRGKIIPRACKPNTPHRLEVVTKYVVRAEQRIQKRLAKLGGGTVMHMRQPADLSAKDSELLLFEYSEEFPPLVLQPGMAANVLNYARYPSTPAAYNPNLGDKYEYGTITYCKKSPFLGQVGHGKVVPTIESSVFRAPIYQHDMPTTDFLVIRNRKKYFIRRVARIFCVGQECPLVEVPSPRSKHAVSIQQNHMQSRILRLFAKSDTQPPRLDFAELARMFPHTHQDISLLRKKLRSLAKAEKQGKHTTWVLNKDYKLPQEEEIRELCRPDDFCALFSMRCAEQRLQDAGYGQALAQLSEDEAAGNEKSLEEKTHDEIKAAPWNTTRAFLSAMQGKCMLEVQGVADPTGCGEGISYTRLRTKGREKGTTRAEAAARRLRKVQMAQNRSMVSGTQADLRKLKLGEAREMLLKHGFTKDTIWNMKRWEAIHLIRQVGIHEARAGQGGAFAKFSRGPKKSIQELTIKFRSDCQKVFTVQHQTLSATAADESEDESDDGGEDGATKDKEDGSAANITSASAGEIDWQAFANQLESNMLQRGKSKQQIEHEIEEKERRLLKQLLTETSEAAKKQAGDADGTAPATSGATPALTAVSSSNNVAKLPNDAAAAGGNRNKQQKRKLEIRRTYIDPVTSNQYIRTEVVKDPAIIDLYTKIRSSKAKSLLPRLLGVSERGGGAGGMSAAQARIRRYDAAQSSNTAADTLDGIDGAGNEPRRRGRRPLDEREKEIRKYKKEHMRRDRDREREKNQRVQCSACLQFGHMKSNRICPRFDETYGPGASLRKGRPGAFDDDDVDMDEFGDEFGGSATLLGDTDSLLPSADIAAKPDGLPVDDPKAGAETTTMPKTDDEGGVRVEGTKLVFTKKLVESAQEDLHKQQQLKREEDEKQRLLREDLNLSDDDEDADDDDDEDSSRKRQKRDADYRPPPHATQSNAAASAESSGGGLILKIRRDSFVTNPAGDAGATFSGGAELPGEQPHESPFGTYHSPSTRSDGGIGTPTGGGSVGSGGERRPARGSRRGGRSSANDEIPADTSRSRLSTNRRARPESPDDLYSRPAKQVHQRWRTDPFVFINSRLDAVLKELRGMKQATLFLVPVRDIEFPDYRRHVHRPMDLSTMRSKVKRGAEPNTSMSSVADENDERLSSGNVYRSRGEFIADLEQIVHNSAVYNGPDSEITNNARHLVDVAKARLYGNEKVSEELATEERRIDPRADPNAEPKRCLNEFFQQIVEQTMKIDSTQQKIFCKPVSAKVAPDYAEKVARPIDLGVILDSCKRRNYTRLDQFRADVELIRSNSQTYNGNDHPITRIASKIVDYALAKMEARNEVLKYFEERIEQQEAEAARATEAAVPHENRETDEVFSPPPNNEAAGAAGVETDAVHHKTAAEAGAAGIMEDLELSDEEEEENERDENAPRLTERLLESPTDGAGGPSSPFAADEHAAGIGAVADDGGLVDEDDERSTAARMMMMDIDDESVLARWRSDEAGDGEYGDEADDNVGSPEGSGNVTSGAAGSTSRRLYSGGMSKPSSERIATYSEPTSPETFEDRNATASRNTRELAASIGLPLPPMNFGLPTGRRVADDYDDSDDELVVAPEDQIQQHVQQRPAFLDDDELDERMFEANDGDDMMRAADDGRNNIYTAMPSSPPLMMRPTGGAGQSAATSPSPTSVGRGGTGQAGGERLSDEDDDEISGANFDAGNKPISPNTTMIQHAADVPTGDAATMVQGDAADDDEFGDLLTFDSAARIAGYADEYAEQPSSPAMASSTVTDGAAAPTAALSEEKEKGETLSDSSDEGEL